MHEANISLFLPQLYSIGEDSELLVTVEQADRRNKDSPVTVRITTTLPELWLFALGALFVVSTLFLPKGIVGLWAQIFGRRKPVADAPPATPEQSSDMEKGEDPASFAPAIQPKPAE